MRRAAGILLLGFVLAAIQSCAPALPLDEAAAAISNGLDEIAPGFRMEASHVIDEGRLMVEVRAALSPADVPFVLRDEVYEAVIPLSFRLRDRRGRELLAEGLVRDTLRFRSRDLTRDDRPIAYGYRFEAPDERVVAEVVLLDDRREPLRWRRQPVDALSFDRRPFVTEPRIFRADQPTVGMHLTTWRWADAVRLIAQADEPESTITYSVRPVRADTAVASRPYWISPTRGSLAFRGAFFEEELPEVWSASSTAGVDLPLLEEGVYVVAAALEDASPEERPLVVLPADHPRMAKLDQMVDALTYISYRAELDHIREGRSAAERQERFDDFWVRLFPTARQAEQVMRTYYERVEEANRRFTSHKPGWMTDQGMIYIVLGPPEVVERDVETETWRYAFGQAEGARSYTFERVNYDGAPWPEHHLVLQRAPRYETTWQHAFRRWREGNPP